LHNGLNVFVWKLLFNLLAIFFLLKKYITCIVESCNFQLKAFALNPTLMQNFHLDLEDLSKKVLVLHKEKVF